MRFLCLLRATLASSSVANSTNASPVALPSTWWTNIIPSLPCKTSTDLSPVAKNSNWNKSRRQLHVAANRRCQQQTNAVSSFWLMIGKQSPQMSLAHPDSTLQHDTRIGELYGDDNGYVLLVLMSRLNDTIVWWKLPVCSEKRVGWGLFPSSALQYPDALLSLFISSLDRLNFF